MATEGASSVMTEAASSVTTEETSFVATEEASSVATLRYRPRPQKRGYSVETNETCVNSNLWRVRAGES